MKRNLAFEALADVTSTDWNAGRGELNKALQSLREQTELDGEILAQAIRRNGLKYRQLFGDNVALTPTALAKHWRRVEVETTKIRGTNQSVSRDECSTCQGDRFVVVATRKPEQTDWMRRHGIEPDAEQLTEEFAGCPDCNPVVHEWRRFDGTLLASPDAARARELMNR